MVRRTLCLFLSSLFFVLIAYCRTVRCARGDQPIDENLTITSRDEPVQVAALTNWRGFSEFVSTPSARHRTLKHESHKNSVLELNASSDSLGSNAGLSGRTLQTVHLLSEARTQLLPSPNLAARAYHEGSLVRNWLFAIGGGTGSNIRNPEKWDSLQRRHRYQDSAVLVLLAVVYFMSLLLSLNFVYWQSANAVPVAYYADPRYHNYVSTDHGIENFLEGFNQPPKAVQLQVTGFTRVDDQGSEGSVSWHGKQYIVAFTFALDLTTWIVRSRHPSIGSNSPANLTSTESGIYSEDIARLQHFLATNTNDLATVELEKHIAWKDWEELATNIKLRIHQCGFDGTVGIHRTDKETVTIYKNKPWTNFMHCRMTRALSLLSLVGWMIYHPYMYLRCSKLLIRSAYHIDVSINMYWDLIADKLSANGFEMQSTPQVPTLPIGISSPTS